jgi:hypothetical protein
MSCEYSSLSLSLSFSLSLLRSHTRMNLPLHLAQEQVLQGRSRGTSIAYAPLIVTRVFLASLGRDSVVERTLHPHARTLQAELAKQQYEGAQSDSTIATTKLVKVTHYPHSRRWAS